LLQQEEKTEEAKQAWQTAGDKNADLKQHLEKGSDCETILAYLVSLLKMALAKEEVASAQPVEEFNPPEVVKRLAERLKKEEPIVVKPTPSQEGAKRPYNLKGEFEQTFEYYDRSPKASSPINMLNTTSRLKVTGSQQPYSFESEWEWYYDRWDHTHLDWYKVNITSPNTSWDIGKFSSRYFPNLVSHPSIEDGVRLWHKFEKPAFEPKLENPLPQLPEGQEAQEVKSEESTPLNIARLYEDSFTDDRTFKSAELTVVSGRSKKPINLNHRKEKNEDTYETSGQYEQWVVASRLLTRPTDTTEANAAWSYVADDPDSATTSSTTLPIKSQAVGMDGKWELLDRKLNLDGEFAFSDYDTDMEDKSNKHLRDFAWMWGTDYKPASNWTMSYDEKRIGHNFKVEGAYQTEDKITHTFTTKYTPSKSQPWSIRSFDLKLEPARTNLNGGSDQTKYYNTAQPKISFTLPQDTKLSFDYKNYQEHWASCCTNYRTNTLATDLDYEYKPWKLTFKPGYTFERKDDRVASPTDEKMKNFRIAFEDRLIERLVLKYSISFEVKEYVGFTTKSYREHKYSFEAGYTLIPGRSTLTIKTSRDDKDPTDTNETILDTYGVDIDFTSKDGNQKFVFAYERKLNIYEPWLDTSAYRQHYMKLKFTSKF
jgi:hypothetical protein